MVSHDVILSYNISSCYRIAIHYGTLQYNKRHASDIIQRSMTTIHEHVNGHAEMNDDNRTDPNRNLRRGRKHATYSDTVSNSGEDPQRPPGAEDPSHASVRSRKACRSRFPQIILLALALVLLLLSLAITITKSSMPTPGTVVASILARIVPFFVKMLTFPSASPARFLV